MLELQECKEVSFQLEPRDILDFMGLEQVELHEILIELQDAKGHYLDTDVTVSLRSPFLKIMDRREFVFRMNHFSSMVEHRQRNTTSDVTDNEKVEVDFAE